MDDKLVISIEKENEYREVENLVRESFWNVYCPGCVEHYLINQLRKDKDFVKELDFVLKLNDVIIGQNVFVKAKINCDDGRSVDILTMGPICVSNEYKRKGYGKYFLDYSLKRAKELGYGAVCIEGNILFYGKSGFTYGREYNLRYHGLPSGADDSFFLCIELKEGYLKGVSGEYSTPNAYMIKEEDIDEFDKQFPPKEKLKLPGQLF